MGNKIFKSLILIVLTSMLFSHSKVMSEEPEGETTEEKAELMYYEIEPNILTFYQGTGRKIGYVVVQVNIAVRGQDNYDLVELHMPLLQDVLIKFFNRQDKSVIQPFSEREQLRLKAMEIVKEALQQEVGKDIVENVLFTNYVYQ